MVPALRTIESLRDKFAPQSDGAWILEEIVRLRVAQQAFFETLAAECRRPHVGDAFKTFTASLLLRAQEARIYTPEEHS